MAGSQGRDIALRCPRPERSAGRNARQEARFDHSIPSSDATLDDGDARAVPTKNCVKMRPMSWVAALILCAFALKLSA